MKRIHASFYRYAGTDPWVSDSIRYNPHKIPLPVLEWATIVPYDGMRIRYGRTTPKGRLISLAADSQTWREATIDWAVYEGSRYSFDRVEGDEGIIETVTGELRVPLFKLNEQDPLTWVYQGFVPVGNGRWVKYDRS